MMVNESETIELDTRGLDAIIKSLKNVPTAKIGILGDKNSRKNGNSNATIGARHEFGGAKTPIRSFLRMPLIEMMQKNIDSSNLFTEEAFKRVLKEGSILEWVKKLAILGEKCVLDAFDTGGYGKWKPSNMMFKTNHQTLVETRQLRESISSEVKE